MLYKVSGKLALELGERALKDSDQSVRLKSLASLARLKTKKANALVISFLDYSNYSIRRLRVRALFNSGISKKEYVPLLEALMKARYYDVKQKAVYSLCAIKGPKTYQVLKKCLKSADRNITNVILSQMRNRPEIKKDWNFVKRLFESDNVSVRRYAVLFMEKISNDAVFPLLKKALEDKDVKVQQYAIYVLGRKKDRRFTNLIEKKLLNKNVSIRSYALNNYLFTKRLTKKDWPLVNRVLKNPYTDVRGGDYFKTLANWR